jgi:hypothetical protein
MLIRTPEISVTILPICTINSRKMPMKSRTIITLDPAVHRLAKQNAHKKHPTVSGLMESLLQSDSPSEKGGVIASMVGSASLRSSAPDTDSFYDALKAKYLR